MVAHQAITARRGLAPAPVPLETFLVPLSVVMVLFWLFVSQGDFHPEWAAAGPFNLVLLALAVSMMARGCRQALLGPTVLGSILLVALVLSRYADFFESLFVRGVLFILIGALIFAEGILYARAWPSPERRGADMKMWLIIAAAALQLLVLAYIAGERETVLLTGRTVYLRTAPVDPRDLFRGDYVTLNYEINSLRRDRVHDEAYFVEQGKGRELESRLSRTAEVQVPLEMEVKLAGNGLAVLKGYRWSPLGIGLTLDTDKERHATGATVRLLNSSDKELAIVDLPGGRSFTLDTDTTWNPDEKTWRWVGADTPRPAVAAEQVHMLKPRESHVFKFDFADPAWFIARPGEKPMPIGQFKEWQSSFRLLYRPPAEDAVRGLPNAETIWHGELPSRAFSGGRVD